MLATLTALPEARGQGARRDEAPGGEAEGDQKKPELTKPPRLIEAAAPEYPAGAAEDGLEADVPVRIHIDATGAVTKVEVSEPAGHGFDEAAVRAAEQYRFEPAEFDGEPGPIVVETTIHFVLEEQPAPEQAASRPSDGEDGAAPPQGPPSHGGDPRQPITIAGQALERGTRRELDGVIVSVSELGIDAVTDENGRFFFHGVPAGEYTILAASEAFDRFDRALAVDEDERVDVVLYLRPQGGNPYETVVEGERETLEVTRRTVNRRQMTTVPGTFGDPLRVIQSLPGMARSPASTGFLLVRGSNPDDSGVFIDGHRVPQLFHFLGGPSILNSEFLDTLNLYPGGYPARFGRSIGGIVSVETRPTVTDGVHGSADVDFLDASGYVRAPLGDNGSIAFAGRRSYLDFMLGFFLPEQEPGSRLIVTPRYHDYQGRLDYSLEEDGHVTLFVIGSSDKLDVLSENSEDEESFDLGSSIDFTRLIASYKRDLGGGLELTMSPAVGRDRVALATGRAGEGAFTRFAVTQNTLGYRMRVDGDIASNVYLDTGVDIESRVAEYDILAPFEENIPDRGQIDIPPQQVTQTADLLSYGVYTNLALDLGDLRLIPGLRFDGHVLSGQSRLSVDPRLVARYRVGDEWVLKGYGGVFHQPPQPESFDETFGNPALGLERAIHTGFGAEWEFLDHWRADGEVYYIDRKQLVQYSPQAEFDEDTGTATQTDLHNSGEGDTVGLELLIKREITRNLYGWLSYTLSRTRVRDTLSEEGYAPSPFDQRHGLNAVASYRTDGGWEFGAKYQLATGRPDTPIVGATFEADDGDYEPVTGEFRSAREDTFHQLDVRAERTWLFKTWRLSAYLDILNVLNIENAEATQYDYRFRESAAVSSVPFVPTLGIQGKW